MTNERIKELRAEAADLDNSVEAEGAQGCVFITECLDEIERLRGLATAVVESDKAAMNAEPSEICAAIRAYDVNLAALAEAVKE